MNYITRMPSILITRLEHDPLTRYLSHWNKKIIDKAESKGNNIIDLHRDSANKKAFEGRMKKVGPSLVLLNGHGDDSSIAGHDDEVLVKVGENELLLKNRITYAVACSAAKILGAACADADTAFIGYDEYFFLNLDRRFLANPLNDKRAQKFLEPSNKVANSLIKGHTCQEASNNSKKEFRENIRLLLSTAADLNSLDDAKDLFWNMTHQVCLGNQEMKL